MFDGIPDRWDGAPRREPPRAVDPATLFAAIVCSALAVYFGALASVLRASITGGSP